MELNDSHRMISTRIGETLFMLQVGAVCLVEQRVLLCSVPGLDFWFLPGGRVHAGERAEDALVRELHEELDVSARAERLLWIVENFFTVERQPVHEIGLYFLTQLASGYGCHPCAETFERVDAANGVTLSWRWHPIESLPTVDLRPHVIAEALSAIPATPVHLIQ